MSDLLYVPVVKSPDGVLLVPVDSDFYEVTEQGGKEAGELLLDIMTAHQLEAIGTMEGTSDEFQARSTGTRTYDDIEFLELVS